MQHVPEHDFIWRKSQTYNAMVLAALSQAIGKGRPHPLQRVPFQQPALQRRRGHHAPAGRLRPWVFARRRRRHAAQQARPADRRRLARARLARRAAACTGSGACEGPRGGAARRVRILVPFFHPATQYAGTERKTGLYSPNAGTCAR